MTTQHLTASDLMIGDWVQIVPDAPAMANEYHRIDWIRSGEIGLDNRNIVTYPYIQPIPITPEILEKNGWHIPKHKIWYQNDDVTFYMCRYTDGTYGIYTDGESEFSNFCNIRFVHELQRALRCCGLYGLANSFAV